ncbi:condensation domain-containing protein [Phytohabitans houttuyneae]|uniref:Condensation domain-containing protein n=1 Tax=Phytohabitans houttuyneae TaxID=1076126 RepID=A0A6V8K6X3_9ACTN|nr:condensation domain-containing protein [Phytohabitans houttuyneae]GFJ78058.1 hypothetical protein Phou_022380 [Phytohabitans houttuyneae]
MDGHIDVPFTAEHGGTGPLTWGQRGMWDAMGRNPTSQTTIAQILPLPASAARTPDAVAQALARTVARHQALRTRLVSTGAGPRQVAAQTGEIALRVYETERDRLQHDTQRIWYEIATQPTPREDVVPLEACLVMVDGAVQRIVFGFNHLTLDWHASQIVLNDVRSLLTAGTFATDAAMQPLDVARWEQESGRSRTDRAVRYWREQCARIPLTMLSAPAGPGRTPRSQEATFTSPALNAAARRLAAHHRLTTSTVLLVATATMLGAWTGHKVSALTVIVHNRFRAAYRHVVSNLQQGGLLTLDLDGEVDFDELLTRGGAGALATYRHAYYEQAAVDRVLTEAREARGGEVLPYCCFNDVSTSEEGVPRLAAEDPDRDAVMAMRPQTRLHWLPEPSQVRCRFCLRLRGSGASRMISLNGDSVYLPPHHLEAFLYGLEHLVVTAAFEPVSLAQVREQCQQARTDTADFAGVGG